MAGSSKKGESSPPVLVVKIGGTEGVDAGAVAADVKALVQRGRRLVVVHGGSAEANRLGEALDHPPRFVQSPSGFNSRFTDARTLEIFTMAVNGKVNTELVSNLQMEGVNALGLSGVDGGLLRARRKSAIRVVENGKQKVLRGDFTGQIRSVNATLLQGLLEDGYTPVVAPLAISRAGETVNVDADRAAAMIAGGLQAHTLVLLTAAPGLLRAFPDEDTLIKELSAEDLEEAYEYARGRMMKKVLGAQEALQGGVRRVVIADGRVPAPIAAAMSGGGTWIR